MVKTQIKIISRLVNRYNKGSAKEGWTLRENNGKPFLALQKLNEINQAYKLEEKYPDMFKTESKLFSLVYLFLLDDLKARALIVNKTY